MLTDKLYHYCSLKTAVEHILPHTRLLLNPFGKTNDPRENKCFSFAHSNIDFSTSLDNVSSDISEEIRRNCKVICFSMDLENLFGYEFSRMWALYGDNHKGVCIELDRNKFIKENPDKIDPLLLRVIKYEDYNARAHKSHKEVDHAEVRRLGISKYVQEVFLPEHVDHLFFEKNREWDSENECRLIYFSESRDNEYCSIKKSMNRIILGVDFDLNYHPSIAKNLGGVQIDKLYYSDFRLFPSEPKF